MAEATHMLGECCQFGAVGQDGFELEPVDFGQGVGVGEDPARDGAGRRRAGADRLGLAAKVPADVVADAG
ncbi:hypothetical protein ADK59_35700 [Streptomyces sp. XY332]|nr:hypothetical protein ADK59_35700 [Streptomyces sp. XY332]